MTKSEQTKYEQKVIDTTRGMSQAKAKSYFRGACAVPGDPVVTAMLRGLLAAAGNRHA